MFGVTSISSRFREALGADGWRGVAPLCIRPLRARFDVLGTSNADTTDAFDERFGVNTREITCLAKLQIDSPHKGAGVRYEPTDPNASDQMLTQVPADMVAQATFIDVRCGRGSVLLLAAPHGFKNVVGIDFSKELCPCCARQH